MTSEQSSIFSEVVRALKHPLNSSAWLVGDETNDPTRMANMIETGIFGTIALGTKSEGNITREPGELQDQGNWASFSRRRQRHDDTHPLPHSERTIGGWSGELRRSGSGLRRMAGSVRG